MIGNKNVFERIPANEVSAIAAPRVSASDICSELMRISRAREKKAEHTGQFEGEVLGIVVVCL